MTGSEVEKSTATSAELKGRRWSTPQNDHASIEENKNFRKPPYQITPSITPPPIAQNISSRRVTYCNLHSWPASQHAIDAKDALATRPITDGVLVLESEHWPRKHQRARPKDFQYFHHDHVSTSCSASKTSDHCNGSKPLRQLSDRRTDRQNKDWMGPWIKSRWSRPRHCNTPAQTSEFYYTEEEGRDTDTEQT